MFTEMMSDLLNALREILVGGIRIQTQPTGNLANGQVFIETEVEDAAVRFFQLPIHVGDNVVETFQPLVNGLQFDFVLYGHQALHFIVKLPLSDSVQTSIAHGGQQIIVILW
jgi:hypothetical protein